MRLKKRVTDRAFALQHGQQSFIAPSHTLPSEGMGMYFVWDKGSLAEALQDFRGCFTKPQWRHFTTYVTGLVTAEKGQKNVMDIADGAVGGRHQSSLNRFLTRRRWPLRRVDHLRLRGALPRREGGILVLDDSVVEKEGTHIQGCGYLYDHSQGRTVWGHSLVSTFYSNGDAQVPMHLSPYVKVEDAPHLGVPFRTKIQMATDLLERDLQWVQPEAVAFDSWYFAKELVDLLSAKEQQWVTEARRNRLVRVGEEWVQLRALFRSLPKEAFHHIQEEVEERRYRWMWEGVVEMKNVGEVKLVLLRTRRNSRGFRALVSNDVEMGGSDLLKLYKRRWDIEVQYRDCKQHLGMGEYQMRSIRGIVTHLSLVFLAYTLLKNAWCSPFLSAILDGVRTIGKACERLKRWVLERLIKHLTRKTVRLPI